MDSIVLIIVASLFFAPYIIYQYLYKKRGTNTRGVELLQAEAGPTPKKWFCNKVDLMNPVNVDISGIQRDPSLQYYRVKNNCMSVWGIYDGDVIGVRPFDDTFTVNDTKEGSILLIFLDDQYFRGYKIREKGMLENNGMAYSTYHYKGGKQHKSSKPHSIDSIKGVVVEVHGKTYIGSFPS